LLFFLAFLKNRKSSSFDHFGPNGSSYVGNRFQADKFEKDAILQDIFKTAGKYEKKNWARATVLDRDLMGVRKYKSKSWVKLEN